MRNNSVHNSLIDSNNIYLLDCLLETHHLPLMPHPHPTHQLLHVLGLKDKVGLHRLGKFLMYIWNLAII